MGPSAEASGARSGKPGFWRRLRGLFAGSGSEPGSSPSAPPFNPHIDLIFADTGLARQVLEQTVLPRVAGPLGLAVDRPEADRFLLRGSLGAFRFRSEITDTVTVAHEVRFDNRRGVLSLHWNYDGSVRPFESDASDPMPERVHRFLADGVYLREFPEEADQMSAIVNDLPPAFRDQMLAFIPGIGARSYEIDADRALLLFYLSDLGVEQAVSALEASLRHAHALAEIFSEGPASVTALPRAYVGARPAVVQAQATASCAYCGALVALTPGQCQGCGAPISLRA